MVKQEKNPKGDHDGYWGIYQSKKLLPIERYDPFSTYMEKSGSIIGHKTIFSPIRRKRPLEFETAYIDTPPTGETHSSILDTFCRLIKGNIPSIVISKDQDIESDPFSVEPTENDLSSATTISTINLYPPIARVLNSSEQSVYNDHQIPVGLSFVHILTQHYMFPEEVPTKSWQIFLKNYCLTIESCINHPKIKHEKNIILQTAFNIGQRAGASIPHLHGQSILYINNSGSGSKYNSYLRSSQNQKECLKCTYWTDREETVNSSPITIHDRILWKNENWMAFLAFAPEKDAHIRLLPRRHVPALWLLSEEEINSLASILIKSNAMLTRFIEEEGEKFNLVKDRNIIFRQLIDSSNSHFHMFIDILPVQQLGGLELFDNQKISSELPETISLKIKSLFTNDSLS